MGLRRIIFLSLFCFASFGQAASPPENLRVGVLGDITAMDPHMSFMDLNLQVHAQVYDRLYDMGPQKELLPSLALEHLVTPGNAREWQIRLRSGVRFHRGQNFTKQDVLCTFERIQAFAAETPSGYQKQLDAFDLVATKAANDNDPDPLRLKIVTKAPYAFVPSNLASILVMSCAEASLAMGRPMSEVQRDFANGALVNGTGPYRFVSWSAGKVTLEASALPTFRIPHWKQIEVIAEPSEGRRVERLLTREFDLIANAPNAGLDEIRRRGFGIFQTASQRMVHMQLYQNRDAREQSPLHIPLVDEAGNAYPLFFANRFIREAFWSATKKENLVNVMGGQAVPTGQYMLPGRVGYRAEIAADSYGPEEARRLLALAAEAPEFAFLKNRRLILTIHGPDGRYPNDALVLQELARTWTEVFGDFEVDGVKYSIRVDAKPEPMATYFRNLRNYNVLLLGGGIDNGHAEGAVRLYLLPTSGLNYTNYQNQRILALYNEAVGETISERADALLSEAIADAIADRAILPLYNQVGVWAAAPNFELDPRIDELTLPDTVRYIAPK